LIDYGVAEPPVRVTAPIGVATSRERQRRFFTEAAISLASCSNYTGIALHATQLLANAIPRAAVTLMVRTSATSWQALFPGHLQNHATQLCW
jgi:hypothetical protein